MFPGADAELISCQWELHWVKTRMKWSCYRRHQFDYAWIALEEQGKIKSLWESESLIW